MYLLHVDCLGRITRVFSCAAVILSILKDYEIKVIITTITFILPQMLTLLFNRPQLPPAAPPSSFPDVRLWPDLDPRVFALLLNLELYMPDHQHESIQSGGKFIRQQLHQPMNGLLKPHGRTN